MSRAAALAALLLAVAACGGQSALARPGAPALAPATPAPLTATPQPTPTPAPAHVFVVVMENASYEEALAQPGIAALAGRYGLATNYHAVAHPSLPNYLALTSGSTFGIRDDSYHPLPKVGLDAELDAAGVGWRAYFQGMSRGCLQSGAPYALKHNPFAYYGGGCPAGDHVVAFDQLQADLALDPARAPRLSWITPDLCNDGHDCGPAAGDRFLAQLVPEVEASPAWKAGGVLFITWDEDDGSAANRVALLAVGSGIHGTTDRAYDHYSLLATVEDLLQVGRLGQSAGAQPIGDLVHLPGR